jgi:hypothetical protein
MGVNRLIASVSSAMVMTGVTAIFTDGLSQIRCRKLKRWRPSLST